MKFIHMREQLIVGQNKLWNLHKFEYNFMDFRWILAAAAGYCHLALIVLLCALVFRSVECFRFDFDEYLSTDPATHLHGHTYVLYILRHTRCEIRCSKRKINSSLTSSRNQNTWTYPQREKKLQQQGRKKTNVR